MVSWGQACVRSASFGPVETLGMRREWRDNGSGTRALLAAARRMAGACGAWRAKGVAWRGVAWRANGVAWRGVARLRCGVAWRPKGVTLKVWRDMAWRGVA